MFFYELFDGLIAVRIYSLTSVNTHVLIVYEIVVRVKAETRRFVSLDKSPDFIGLK